MKQIALGVLLCFVAGVALADGVESPLDWIPSRDLETTAPFWVSTEIAIKNEQMRWEFFQPGGKRATKALITMAEKARLRASEPKALGECYGTTLQKDLHERFDGLDALESAATEIYSGTVTGESQGFIEGWPGTLYEIAVEQDHKSPSHLLRPRTVYFYFPWANFVINGTTVCHQGSRGDDRPQVGRQILAFVISPHRSEEPQVLSLDDGDLFYERADGSSSFPRRYGELETPTSFDEFLESVVEQLRLGRDEE